MHVLFIPSHLLWNLVLLCRFKLEQFSPEVIESHWKHVKLFDFSSDAFVWCLPLSKIPSGNWNCLWLWRIGGGIHFCKIMRYNITRCCRNQYHEEYRIPDPESLVQRHRVRVLFLHIRSSLNWKYDWGSGCC